ncbi:MAG: hypothetical protein A2W93_09990 [Bacteroidetes bacterium GWF2_43_63]|nr:MAG: hypothetical protein A2W94_02475 [Bacteroidetes bacterium GWE2_42_42]OFY52853.1 MAG: hypothetical protein A2W93_09990 [Bacteroidetes bacterium GWF2_43_63]HBG70059.1 hypothetical protein [Bacteroidales bacterium]HCB62335.1 hypothetical protein [Bacteroidales bacterium]
MKKNPIYTIGHGHRKQDEFLGLLKQFEIQYLIDVRSQPYSKFNPDFNQNEIKLFLEKNSVKYVYMGDTLGGMPKDLSCYTPKGIVDYEILKSKDFFLKGIDRLIIANDQDLKIVILCSESKPTECHRTKLIGRVLSEHEIAVVHIDEKGKLKDQITVINELNKGYSEIDLFGEKKNTTSRKPHL